MKFDCQIMIFLKQLSKSSPSLSSKADPEITYSGPSYIAIRSKKHLLSITYTHGRDIKHFLSWRNFKKIVRSGNSVKSIRMIFCDSGPDENNFDEAPPLT